jgi:hypothetical protein
VCNVCSKHGCGKKYKRWERKKMETIRNKLKTMKQKSSTKASKAAKQDVSSQKTTNSKIDLDKPLDNAYVNNMKDIANVRISFLKSIYGNKYFAILGALGQPGNTVKILDEKGSNLGIFKVMDSISGETLKKIKITML